MTSKDADYWTLQRLADRFLKLERRVRSLEIAHRFQANLNGDSRLQLNARIAELEAERDAPAPDPQKWLAGVDWSVDERQKDRERIAALEEELRWWIGNAIYPGHPGRPCLRTGWIPVERVKESRALLDGTTEVDDG